LFFENYGVALSLPHHARGTQKKMEPLPSVGRRSCIRYGWETKATLPKLSISLGFADSYMGDPREENNGADTLSSLLVSML